MSAQLQEQVVEAIEANGDPLKIVDVADLIEQDRGEVRDAVFAARDAGLIEGTMVSHEGGKFQAFQLGGADKKGAKKRTKKSAKGKSQPAEKDAVSLRMRISEREDGSYSVIVRQPGQAKKRLNVGKCDDSAEAGSVALTKLLG